MKEFQYKLETANITIKFTNGQWQRQYTHYGSMQNKIVLSSETMAEKGHARCHRHENRH